MVDNVSITTGADATVATDDVAGVHYQRTKIDLGGDGLASPLVRGQQTAANSLPVTLPSDQGALAVTIGATVTVDGSGVTQPVSATSLPLPTGASTAAKQPAIGTAGTASADVITVQGIAAMTALKVDGSAVTQPVSGTVTANLAAGTNNIGDVDVLTLPALPAGTNAIGKLAANSGVDIGDVDVTSVNGQSAHDAAIAGAPIRLGGRALTADYAAVVTGDTADLMTDLNGRLVVRPYCLPENSVVGVTAAITTATNTSVIAAAGAGVRNYVTSLTVTNSHATVGSLVTITDGAAGTSLWAGYAAPAGGGFTLTFPVPLKTTANTALYVTTGSAGNVYVSAAGFKGI